MFFQLRSSRLSHGCKHVQGVGVFCRFMQVQCFNQGHHGKHEPVISASFTFLSKHVDGRSNPLIRKKRPPRNHTQINTGKKCSTLATTKMGFFYILVLTMVHTIYTFKTKKTVVASGSSQHNLKHGDNWPQS